MPLLRASKLYPTPVPTLARCRANQDTRRLHPRIPCVSAPSSRISLERGLDDFLSATPVWLQSSSASSTTPNGKVRWFFLRRGGNVNRSGSRRVLHFACGCRRFAAQRRSTAVPRSSHQPWRRIISEALMDTVLVLSTQANREHEPLPSVHFISHRYPFVLVIAGDSSRQQLCRTGAIPRASMPCRPATPHLSCQSGPPPIIRDGRSLGGEDRR